MKLPNEVKQVRDQYIAKFPFPGNGQTGADFENEFREWFGKFVQQIVFSFPDDNFGWKSSSPTNPPSKDVLAQQLPLLNNRKELIGWDIFDGVGTGKPKLNSDPDSIPLTGQHFIPMDGVDYISGKDVPNDDDDDDDDDDDAEDEIDDDESESDETVKLLLMQVVSKLTELVDETKVQTATFKTGLTELKTEITKGIKIKF